MKVSVDSIKNSQTDQDALTIVAPAPNLTFYTGEGSVNTYSYDETSDMLTITSSIQNDGSSSAHNVVMAGIFLAIQILIFIFLEQK